MKQKKQTIMWSLQKDGRDGERCELAPSSVRAYDWSGSHDLEIQTRSIMVRMNAREKEVMGQLKSSREGWVWEPRTSATSWVGGAHK